MMSTFSRDGVRLAYTIVGTGQPLVIVHGAASSARSLADCADVLAERRRVILPDLRGMGGSDRISTLHPTDWVDDLLALLDHLDVGTIDLAGVSLGARIATRFTLDHPDRVSSLILDAPMLCASAEGEVAVNLIFGPSRDNGMATLLQQWHGSDWESVTATYLRLRQIPELQTYLDFTESLERIAVPVFVTRGDADDPIHPVSHAAEFNRRIGRSDLWIAPSTQFSLARFRPKEWATAVDQFIWALDLGSREVRAHHAHAQIGEVDA
jgi:pimeloyl-ACP methyl ester carboxylesterase